MQSWKQLSSILSPQDRPENLAFALALVFGIVSAVLVPQMLNNDEGAHFLKSYSLSAGSLYGSACSFPQDVVEKVNSAHEGDVTNNFNDPIEWSESVTTTCGSASNYSPIMHLPQALGIAAGKPLNASASSLVLMGRLSNAVFYAAALYFIVRYVRIAKLVFVVVGLFPLMVHTAGSLSGDVMNNIIVMVFIAFLLNLFIQNHRISNRQMAILILLAIGLALTKATNLVLLLPLLALPGGIFKPKKLPYIKLNKQKWLLIGFCGAFAVMAVFIAQNVLGSALFFREIPVENPLVRDPLRFIYILWNTYLNPAQGYGDLLLRGVVGEFASFSYHLPSILVYAELTLLGIVLLYRDEQSVVIKRRQLNYISALSAISLAILTLAITFALYSAWAITSRRLGVDAVYADGVQGRYFTAALLLLIPIGIWLQKYVHVSFRAPKIASYLVFAVSGFCLAFYVLLTYLTFT